MKLRFALLALVFLVIVRTDAAPPWSSLGEAVAIQGYDPVAYFTTSQATRGNAKYFYEWQAMTWFFSSPENRDLFTAAPDKYAPQFGGFCALSVADGKNARGSGEAWTVHEGKLYLNANKSVMANFRTDPNRWIAKAEGWWPTIKSRLEKE